MEKFTIEEVDKTFRKYKVNELAEGIVVAKKSDGLVFNLGGKLDAFIPQNECLDFDRIKIGDRFKVVIINKRDADGNVVASEKIAKNIEIGNQTAENIKLGSTFTCVITNVTGSGALISKMGEYHIYIPEDEICSWRQVNPKSYISKQVQAVATEINNEEKKIVASIKIIDDKTRAANQETFWRSIFLNKIVDGTVKRIVPYGAFVEVGGVDCLLHISDVSYEKINSVSEVLKVGETYKFKVIKLDRENQKVGLGYKQLQESLKHQKLKEVQIGDKMTAKAIKILPYGAILKTADGVEGLLHIRNATEDRRQQIQQIVKLDEEIEVYVKSVDLERDRVEFAII